MTPRPQAAGVLVALMLLVACSAGVPGPSEEATSNGAEDVPGAGENVTVRRADLSLNYTLDATTAEGSRIGLVPNDRLELVPASRQVDRRVRQGELLGRLRVKQSVLASLAALGSGAAASERASLRSQERSLVAPVDGSVHGSGSDPTIEAPGIDVVATLSPIQYLRYLSLPFEASAHVETVLGPVTVRCLALWSTPSVEATNEAAASLHCRLPGHVETAPGLRSTLEITSTTVKDALLVPNLYIGYDEAADQYFVTTTQRGTDRRVLVQVGPSDGVVRVVRGDLQPGDVLARADGGDS